MEKISKTGQYIGPLTLGGSLYLRGTGITSLPEGLTVGGSLYLEGTGITSLPEGLTVGGSLYLEGTGITSLPEGLTVGGSLDLEGTGITSHDVSHPPNALFWPSNYCLIDGIFAKVVHRRGNVLKLAKIGSEDILYAVTDGLNWAHGHTVRQAMEDLVYKSFARNTEEYRATDPDKPIPFSEAIGLYRSITGACSLGVRDFIESRGIEERDYTVIEIKKLTKGCYGHDKFVEFFPTRSGS